MISITITISYFLGTREINVTSISTDYPFGSISLYGTIVNSFKLLLNLPSPGILKLNLNGTVEVLNNLTLRVFGNE